MVAANNLRVMNSPRVNRKTRSPQHTWAIKQRPFVITPFMIAPVLPGETLKAGVMQARAVSEPLNASRFSSITGWWLEHYVFYVRHSQMPHAELFKSMMIDPTTSLAAAADATVNSNWYHPGTGINWVKECMVPVVENYFRDEGDAWDAYVIDGEPIAQINGNGVFDSVATAIENDRGDLNLDLNADNTIKASEAAKALMMWEYLRSNNLTEMTYEDYLRTFGVKVDVVEEALAPELLRYSREWQYPNNVVDPTSGVPTPGLSWGINLRMDKDRYVKEPGFIFGVTVARPKLYLGNQRGPAVHLMQDGISWLPIMLRDNDFSSMKQVTKAGSILPTATADGFYVDIADIFVHGDQFFHNDVAGTQFPLAGPVVALPEAGLNARYPTEAMVDGLFKAVANNVIYQDGVMRMSILGTIVDTTPRASVVGLNL
nr:major capsid protein [Rattus norvegicus microvirus]